MSFPGFETGRRACGDVEIAYAAGGAGPPLLLLHGYPQTHLIWHRVAPELAKDFRVICPDLRGYGASSKPATDRQHTPYSFRAMAADMAALMSGLGYARFSVAGHDRGGRVTHRLVLDHESQIERWCVIDIAPTLSMYEATDMAFARAYYHWFFLIQPFPVPETLIAGNPEAMVRACLEGWSQLSSGEFDRVFPPDIVAHYVNAFASEGTIHATCEDYRAAASIDLDHDRADLARVIEPPCLCLWGANSLIGKRFDPLAQWRARARHVSGHAVPGSGHFIPEEQPDALLRAFTDFFQSS